MIIAEQTPDVYEQLIAEYQAMMYYSALKVVKDSYLAEDIVQESWIKIFRNNPSLQHIAKLGAWIKTITIRTAIDMVRKENAGKCNLLEDPELLEELTLCSCNDVDEQINWLFTFKELEECLHKNKKLIEVFQLKFKLGFTDQEIATTLNISLSAAKSRIFRTRQLFVKYKETEKNTLLNPGA